MKDKKGMLLVEKRELLKESVILIKCIKCIVSSTLQSQAFVVIFVVYLPKCVQLFDFLIIFKIIYTHAEF